MFDRDGYSIPSWIHGANKVSREFSLSLRNDLSSSRQNRWVELQTMPITRQWWFQFEHQLSRGWCETKPTANVPIVAACRDLTHHFDPFSRTCLVHLCPGIFLQNTLLPVFRTTPSYTMLLSCCRADVIVGFCKHWCAASDGLEKTGTFPAHRKRQPGSPHHQR